MPRHPHVPHGPTALPFRWTRASRDVPRHLTESPSLRRVTRGVYAPAEDVDDFAVRCRGLSLVIPPGAALSHTTAAQLMGAPLPLSVADRLHVSVPREFEAPQRNGVYGHQVALPPDHLVRWREFAITTPARTFVDLGGQLDVANLVAVGDFLLAEGRLSLSGIRTMADWAAGRRGVKRARLAMDLLDPGSASRPESLIRVWVVQAGLPPPEANGWICDPAGIPTYRGDLVFRMLRVIVEYEGAHHRGRGQYAADLRRRNDLVAWGWRIVHVEAEMLATPERVVALVRQALQA
jgi:hypothetical protein